MPTAKILPLNHACDTRKRLVNATGVVLSRAGFAGLTPDSVADAAGVKRRLLFHHFDGLEGLVKAFSQSPEFWPPASELIGGDEAAIKAMTAEQQIATFFKRYALALLKRPHTLEILAWETVERNSFSRWLEEVRVRTALEFFELLHEDIPEEIDLTAIVLVLAAAVSLIAMRSRTSRSWGGIDLHSDKGWKRIEGAIDLLMQGTLANEGRARS
ncbi:MAG: TetR/AcrR family transcriptional regulator [Desulfohalobiaceae bacterium]